MEGSNTPIEIKGIERNKTKLAVEDGTSADLVNLRFKDGSWRTSGNGKEITSFTELTSGTTYVQIYVHTNVYKHLLGVNNNTLYWFGNITSNDDEEFSALDTRVEICDVSGGDLYITQTGNLLTIIDEDNSSQEKVFRYFIFRKGDNTYQQFENDSNEKQTDRGLFPYGGIHFNLYEPLDELTNDTSKKSHTYGFHYWVATDDDTEAPEKLSYSTLRNTVITAYGEVEKKNLFTDPFLVCAAIKLYDGTYAFSSNPILLFPRQKSLQSVQYFSAHKKIEDENWVDVEPTSGTYLDLGVNSKEGRVCVIDRTVTSSSHLLSPALPIVDSGVIVYGTRKMETVYINSIGLKEIYFSDYSTTNTTANNSHNIGIKHFPPMFVSCVDEIENDSGSGGFATAGISILGSDIICSINDSLIEFANKNKELISSFCIFITPQARLYNLSTGFNSDGKGEISWDDTEHLRDMRRDYSDVKYDLTHSPFYLLREYSPQELKELVNNPIVDLSSAQYEGVLKNIVQQDRLTNDATNRTTYIPKVQYNYNGRLHIANYTSYVFHGYPLDLFKCNGCSLKLSTGSYYPGVMTELEEVEHNTLKNLTDNDSDYKQYGMGTLCDYVYLGDEPETEKINKMNNNGHIFAYVRVKIEDNGINKYIVKYIDPHEHSNNDIGIADYISDLSPLLIYPDSRATEMEIYFVKLYYTYDREQYFFVTHSHYTSYYKKFSLTPMLYLDMAYYVTDDLKPISISTFTSRELKAVDGTDLSNQLNTYLTGKPGVDYDVTNVASPKQAPAEVNTVDAYPNGLKVSGVNNPLFFPAANTYQVGSAEVLALMSNAVAVGTGQTGSAPLYVFCKDGIYALFVDSSGTMCYTNSRIIARDVVSVPKSVTPVDEGIIFTTERGLMSISGTEVLEIGQPAEGETPNFSDDTDKANKILKGCFTHAALAGLDFTSYAPTADFLTYLHNTTNGKSTIINYNHNNRELMVSNPNYGYSWILDSNGYWIRRTFTADEYVNNYPTSYRLHNGTFYKVDTEGDSIDEANNGFFVLSNVIKLGNTGFKKGIRAVVRGLLKNIKYGRVGTKDVYSSIGFYIFGSQDGRQWCFLGGNERPSTNILATMTDIGCKIERIDVKYLRYAIAGQLDGTSRIDFLELCSDGSDLNGKLR